MKDSLREGIATTRRWKISQDRTIGFMGDDARVYSTPDLVRDIEETCRDFLITHLDQNEDSVGTGIAIRHLAPTLVGMTAEITVTVTALNKNAVSLSVEARDELDLICTGAHDRHIVQIPQTVERLKMKAKRLKG